MQVNATIKGINTSSRSMEVDYEGYGRLNIPLPLDDAGALLTGDALTQHIAEYAPADEIEDNAMPLPDGLDTLVDSVYAVTAMPATQPTMRDKVTMERNRRFATNVVFNGVEYQARSRDRENIAGAAQLASLAIMAGAQAGDLRWNGEDEDFGWIAADNTITPMDAQTVVAFATAIAKRHKAILFAARTIKDMDPIPADYQDDKYWP